MPLFVRRLRETVIKRLGREVAQRRNEFLDRCELSAPTIYKALGGHPVKHQTALAIEKALGMKPPRMGGSRCVYGAYDKRVHLAAPPEMLDQLNACPQTMAEISSGARINIYTLQRVWTGQPVQKRTLLKIKTFLDRAVK